MLGPPLLGRLVVRERWRLGVALARLSMPPVAAALAGLLLCLAVYQLPASYRLALAEVDGHAIGGFWPAETNQGGGFRWTAGEAGVRLPPLGTPGRLRITAIGWRPENQPPPTLTVLFEGQVIASWPTSRAEAAYEVDLPRRARSLTGTHLLLRSETFVPGARDRRTLGVAVRSIEVDVPGGARGPVVPPLAVLALSAALPLLLFRSGRHLGLSEWQSMVVTLAGALALAAPALAGRAGWLQQLPALALGVCLLSLVAAVAPPVVRRTAPAAQRLVVALRAGRLPVWRARVPAVVVADPRRLAWAPPAVAVAVIALHLLSWFVPPEQEVWQSHAWGVRYIYRLPAWLPLLLLGLTALLAIPPVADRLGARLARVGAWLAARTRDANGYALVAVAGLAALPWLWLWRPVYGEFGDAAEIQRKIALEGAIWREREPLDFFLHVQVYRALHPLTGWDVPTIYALLSCLAGAAFVMVVLLMAGLLARSPGARLLVAGLIGTAGYVQLFFGYLESYTLVTAALAVYLLLGLLCLAGYVGPGWPATGLAVAALLHPIALAAAPALAVVLLARWHRQQYRLAAGLRLLLPTVAGLVVPVLLLIALFVANGYTAERWQIAQTQFGGGDKRTFKALVTITSHREYYPLLSLDHARAVLNQQLLVAPLGWPLVLTLLLVGRPRGLWRDPRFGFLLLAAASTGVFVSLWNPDLGARQDWDLLSIGALPAATLAAFLLVRLLPAGAQRYRVGLLLLATNLAHTGLWVGSNSQLLAAWLGGP